MDALLKIYQDRQIEGKGKRERDRKERETERRKERVKRERERLIDGYMCILQYIKMMYTRGT